ncbi:MAG: sugar ABC transporter permease [Eubacteriales bacterium]|nr:sugar ABC transporter permease [Eubacteriales bacterium]
MKEKKYVYWVFVLPVLALYIIYFIIPVGMCAYYSLLDWNGVNKSPTFIGINNYIRLFQDKDYFQAMWFSARYAIFSVILGNVLAIFVALWVNSKLRVRNMMRTCFFLPNIISGIVVGFVWVFIFNQGTKALYSAIPIGLFQIKWLSDPTNAFYAILMVSLWQSVGYYMLIYLSGLNSIDAAYQEAAAIDGANGLARFRYITLPLLMPSITINLFMSTANAFRLFDMNVSLTNGGPGKSTVALALDVYTELFSNSKMGYGSAKAMILLLIVMIITLFQVGYTKKREVDL